jgi:6-phosphogluconolactonase
VASILSAGARWCRLLRGTLAPATSPGERGKRVKEAEKAKESQAQVRIAQDAHEAKRLVAELVAQSAEEAVARRGRFDWVLAGGQTPAEAYDLLSQPPLRWRIPWSKVHVWFSDERCVPPDHPDSNYGMAREHLLGHVDLPADHVHRFLGERPPQEAAGLYCAELGAAFGQRQPMRYAFDLVLLGMGGEGHTASLFPHSPALVWEAPAASVYVEKLGSHRLTLTPRAINDARAVVFLVTGGGKAWAVRESLRGTLPPQEMPPRAIRPHSGTVTWILDPEAAAGLEGL